MKSWLKFIFGETARIRMSKSGPLQNKVPYSSQKPEGRDNTGSRTTDGRKKKKDDAATGVSAASARAVAAQAVAFYLFVYPNLHRVFNLKMKLMLLSRAPVKAFFRTRVECAMMLS